MFLNKVAALQITSVSLTESSSFFVIYLRVGRFCAIICVEQFFAFSPFGRNAFLSGLAFVHVKRARFPGPRVKNDNRFEFQM